jgi:hypothetical protein
MVYESPMNVEKLFWELQRAGIPVEGCDDTGRIDFLPEATVAQQEEAALIVANHDPVWYIEERRAAYPSIEEQLDYIYHHGLQAWADDIITPIKEAYPEE